MNWENRLLEEKILWRYSGSGPHAVFTLSDKHANSYFNSDQLASHTSLLLEACADLYKTAANHKPDWVLTYASYGQQIGACLSKLFGSRFGYLESHNSQEINFNLKAHEKVLLCADDLHTGASMQNLIDVVTARKVEIIGPLMFIVNFSRTNAFNNREVVSLINSAIDVWAPDKCPLCISGSPAIVAREHWYDLYKVN